MRYREGQTLQSYRATHTQRPPRVWHTAIDNPDRMRNSHANSETILDSLMADRGVSWSSKCTQARTSIKPDTSVALSSFSGMHFASAVRRSFVNHSGPPIHAKRSPVMNLILHVLKAGPSSLQCNSGSIIGPRGFTEPPRLNAVLYAVSDDGTACCRHQCTHTQYPCLARW